ncbi:MAG: hypothetical protein LC794_13155 [Acidobacteria bacterium]|nr:hypothetical protein [Acidobacteriota bacterium]MCA1627619.1 hypothetical protein [Acidobacteriota bacterium]
MSYCNRCGFNLREKNESNTGVISAFLTAITVLGTVGLAIMLFGAIVLRRKANLDPQLIGVFMMFTFLIISVTEFMLLRTLSKLTGTKESKARSLPPPVTNDLRLPRASNLGEPVPSVTENTTHTLEYVRRD